MKNKIEPLIHLYVIFYQAQRFEEIWRFRVDPLTDMVIPGIGPMNMYGDSETIMGNNEQKSSPSHACATRRQRFWNYSGRKPWISVDIHDEDRGSFDYSKPRRKSKLSITSENQRRIVTMESMSMTPDQTNSSQSGIDCSMTAINERPPTIEISEELLSSSPEKQCNNKNNDKNSNNNINDAKLNGKHETDKLSVKPNVDYLNVDYTKMQPLSQASLRISSRFKNLSVRTRPSKFDIHRRYSDQPSRIDVDNMATPSRKSGTVSGKSGTQAVVKPNQPPPLRRRRTLKNMEIAKYRVLAAELASRMVIERGSTYSSPSPTSEKPLDGQVDGVLNVISGQLNASAAAFMSMAHSMCRTSPSPKLTRSVDTKVDYRLTNAVANTAVLTIAPVEVKFAETLQHNHSHSPTENKPKSDLYSAFKRTEKGFTIHTDAHQDAFKTLPTACQQKVHIQKTRSTIDLHPGDPKNSLDDKRDTRDLRHTLSFNRKFLNTMLDFGKEHQKPENMC